jgi:PIN domain nuclease of toxin-antitoxin system
MILLDTCAIIFDALTPERLTNRAKKALEEGEQEGTLACSDISLWEVAMLVQKGRLDPGTDYLTFMHASLAARRVRVLPITPEIADLSATLASIQHQDPADRIIAATAVHHGAKLVTADEKLRDAARIPTLW